MSQILISKVQQKLLDKDLTQEKKALAPTKTYTAKND